MARSDKTPRTESRAATRGSEQSQARRFAALFEQHQANAVDSLLRLLQSPVSSLLTWAVIGIALALPLSLLLLLQNLQQVGSGLEQGSTISLFMESGLPPESLTERAVALAARGDVAQVDLITADEALQEFQATSGFGDILQGLDENPLPAVLLVTPVANDPVAISALHAALMAEPGVEIAQLDTEWLQRLAAIIGLASRLALLLAVMLGLGVVLSIGNTVRLAIESRRAEIVVVKLVGGTDAYVARPFLYTGLWYGVGGGLLAVVLVSLALFLLQGPSARLTASYGSDFALVGLGLSKAFLVIAGAALLGWLGAWISVLRNLRAIEPK
jgi:cell division transport system permease protein